MRRPHPRARAAALALFTLSAVALTAYTTPAAAVGGGTRHSPITIVGDENFTAANGVTRGTGSANDPFVIERWDIRPDTRYGIAVSGTTAHFLIRNVTVRGGAPYTSGVYLGEAQNGRIEDSRFEGAGQSLYSAGVFIEGASSISLERNEFVASGLYVTPAGQGGLAPTIAIGSTNRVEGRPVFFAQNCPQANVDGGDYGQILIVQCERVRVANITDAQPAQPTIITGATEVTVEGNSYGGVSGGTFMIEASENVSVIGNHFGGRDGGASISAGSTAALMNNTFANGSAATVAGAEGAVVADNTFVNASRNALGLGAAKNARVERNHFEGTARSALELNGAMGVAINNNTFVGGGANFTESERSPGYVSGGTPSGNAAGGIAAGSSSLLSIDGNRFEGNAGNAVLIDRSIDVWMGNSTFANNEGLALQISRTSGAVVEDSRFAGNGGGGVWITDSPVLTFRRNVFDGEGIRIYGEAQDHFTTQRIGPDNTVNGKPILYHALEPDLDIDGVEAGQIILAGCNNFRVANLSIGPTDLGVFVAYARGGRISGNTIVDLRYDAIKLEDSRDVIIEGNAIRNARWGGATVAWSRGVSVYANEVEGGGSGVWIWGEGSANVTANVLTNQSNAAVNAGYFGNLIMEGNTAIGAGFNVYPVGYYGNAVITTSASNSINGKPLFFRQDCSDLTLDGEAVGQVILHRCDRVTLRNLAFSNTTNAIAAYAVSNLSIEGGVFSNVSRPIVVSGGNRTRVVGNTVEGPRSGASFENVVGLSLERNRFANQTGTCNPAGGFVSWGPHAVYISGSPGATLVNNVFTGNAGNVRFYAPNDATVEANTFGPSGGCGITVDASVVYNSRPNRMVIRNNSFQGTTNPVAFYETALFSVTGNDFNATRGVAVSLTYDSGTVVDGNTFVGGDTAVQANLSQAVNVSRNIVRNNRQGIVLESSRGATVFHNLLIDNALQAQDNQTPEIAARWHGRRQAPATNAWDAGFPLGGNYWSDYTGRDSCSGPTQTNCTGPDGFGDTPRNVSFAGLVDVPADRFPLMNASIPKQAIPPPPPLQPTDQGPTIAGYNLSWLLAAFAAAIVAAAAIMVYRRRRTAAASVDAEAAEVSADAEAARRL